MARDNDAGNFSITLSSCEPCVQENQNIQQIVWQTIFKRNKILDIVELTVSKRKETLPRSCLRDLLEPMIPWTQIEIHGYLVPIFSPFVKILPVLSMLSLLRVF